MLRDDFYIGIVTLNGAKRPGRHDALIDRGTFEQVQKLLDGHRASGDRSSRHTHFLKGTIYCRCGKRLGYGRHRGKCGGIYEYFSCLSRVQRGGRCDAPYFPVEPTERAIVRAYERQTMRAAELDSIRASLRRYIEDKAQIARREAARHERRLSELIGQQQKALQLFYAGKIDERVLEAEQDRIETERAQAQRWAEAAQHEIAEVVEALDDALTLLDDAKVRYADRPPATKRLINQAIFERLTIYDPDSAEATLTPLYAELAAMAPQDPRLARTGRQKARKGLVAAVNARRLAQEDPGPALRGRGSYFEQLAEGPGFEPWRPLVA